MSLTDNVVTRETPIRLARPRWRVIIAETCTEFGIPPETLLAPYGPRRYVAARVTLARRLAAAGYGYAQIGRWLHRDHATILWYCGRKKGHNMGQIINGGLEPIPPPTSQFFHAAVRRERLKPWLRRWITARALATAVGCEYKPIYQDLLKMAVDGIVQRSGYERPSMWRLK
jgi:DNA-binding transcriptional LysR family regulator